MLLVEHDGKALLSQLGIPIPKGVLLPQNQNTLPEGLGEGPWYLKAQVLQGQREKRGLVKRVEQRGELLDAIMELRHTVGTKPSAGIRIESAVSVAEEWFISYSLDQQSGAPRMTVSAKGGTAVQTIHPIINYSTLPPAIAELLTILQNTGATQDVLRLEINPLGLCADGHVVALDAKIELDTSAHFRHPEWRAYTELSKQGELLSPREQAYARYAQIHPSLNTTGRYVEFTGNIALILAGGGASLVAMDALRAAGGSAANYLELSGNPAPETVREAAMIALSHPHLKGIWVAGSFANFTDIQKTVRAALEAITASKQTIPVVIRRDGPGADNAVQEALLWSQQQDIPLRFHRGDVSLEDSAKVLVSMCSLV